MSNSPENIEHITLKGKFEANVHCCLLGIGQLVAWNTILTISDYYYHVFPEYHPSRVLTLVYQPFTIGTILILVFMTTKSKNQRRILIGYSLFAIGTSLLIVLDLINRGSGGLYAYILLCLIVACFGIANAYVEGAMVGELSFMCPEFIQSFAAGMGLSGAITSVLRLITKAAFENSHDGLRKGALLFLAIATLIEILCVVIYAYMFPKLPIVKSYRAKAETNSMETDQIRRLGNKEVIYQNMNRVINLFVIYALTISIFPGFLYENTGKHQLGSWYALVLIACFNAWDSLSRYIPLIKHLKIESGKWMTICVLARLLFVPAFYFTAKTADQGWMILLTSFLGLTNGYFTVCVLTEKSKYNYNIWDMNALGNILVMSIFGGIFAGVCLGWLWLIDTKIAF